MSDNTQCASCTHYIYDNYADEYYCDVDLDEDEQESYTQSKVRECPYYKFYDEYSTVRKQN